MQSKLQRKRKRILASLAGLNKIAARALPGFGITRAAIAHCFASYAPKDAKTALAKYQMITDYTSQLMIRELAFIHSQLLVQSLNKAP